MVRRLSAMSSNLAYQLDRDLDKCSWFSIHCDESVDNSSTAQLLVFIRMAFEDFSTNEELLTLLPLKTTTKGVDIYNTLKEFFVQKKVPLKKMVAMTTDGAPAMISRHTGFVALDKGDPDFPNFPHYHCIIHQQALYAKVIGFEHVMTPVVKIINIICSKQSSTGHSRCYWRKCQLNMVTFCCTQKSSGLAEDEFNSFFVTFE